MPTHYQVLGIAMEATAEDIANAYRKAAFDVLPKHNLYPTSVLAIDKFRVVQDAYECLIKPETRAEYDASLRELAAEEQSLFGERKARRQSRDEEGRKKQKTPPPYVWNEDTNAPLFWTPGRKLIEGPKTDPEAAPAPVAYFKRSSLEKALVKVSTDVVPVQKPVAATPSPTKSAHRRTQSSPLDSALVLRASVTQEVAKAKVRPAVSSQAAYFYGQHGQQQYSQQQPQHLQGWQYSVVAAEYLAKQQAQTRVVEERHRQLVESERQKLQHDLEKRKRAVERERRQKIQVDQEVSRRLAEKEEEMAANYAERMRVKEEMEKEAERLRIKAEKKAKRTSAKHVRWGAAGDSGWGPAGDSGWGPTGDSGWGPAGDSRSGPAGDAGWGPVGDAGGDAGWGTVGDAGFEGAPIIEHRTPETGPYGSGWWSEPELPKRARHNVLKKRRVHT